MNEQAQRRGRFLGLSDHPTRRRGLISPSALDADPGAVLLMIPRLIRWCCCRSRHLSKAGKTLHPIRIGP